MRTSMSAAFAMLLAACGQPHESVFIPEYADLWCAYVLECADLASLRFDGLTDQEDCLAVYGPRIESVGEGCTYKAGKAKRCLRAMELATCPAEGEPLDANVPSVCAEVYVKCPTEVDVSPNLTDTGS